MTVPFVGADLARLKTALAPATVLVVRADDSRRVVGALEQADVAIVQGDIDRRFLEARHLRWVHCDHSGLNKSATPDLFNTELIVTGSAGRSAPALAQHALFLALALTHGALDLYEDQKRRKWRGTATHKHRQSLWGQTMGIVGLGNSGVEVARLAKAFGMRTIALRKTVTSKPPSVDKLLCTDRGDTIHDLLVNSDVVTLAVRLTDDTYHLIGEPELTMMKRSAILINIARGAIINELALQAALRQGTVAGAGLDVFEQEPLPEHSGLWETPNTIITPHTTPVMTDRTTRSLDIICENIRRYRSMKPLINVLQPSDVYRGDAT